MTLKALIAATAMLASPALAAAAAPATSAPVPSKPVELKRLYSGTWIEIGRRPMKLTDGCVAGATTYQIISDVKINVRDSCHDRSPAGHIKSIGGPGRILDPGTNTKLRVSYRVLGFIQVARWDYWVLDHDDAYSWFISADPKFQNLWIYARDPHPDPATLKAVIERARALGYDTNRLEFPAQP
jgi:apolipoprotein D and lipocalin family protein